MDHKSDFRYRAQNLVKLYGCCVDEDHRILVYNYLENNSLAQTLIGNLIYPWKLQ
ncbi:hypothetical protein CsSME_00033189 [Camellia sinensis var. sinensis]